MSILRFQTDYAASPIGLLEVLTDFDTLMGNITTLIQNRSRPDNCIALAHGLAWTGRGVRVRNLLFANTSGATVAWHAAVPTRSHIDCLTSRIRIRYRGQRPGNLIPFWQLWSKSGRLQFAPVLSVHQLGPTRVKCPEIALTILKVASQPLKFVIEAFMP